MATAVESSSGDGESFSEEPAMNIDEEMSSVYDKCIMAGLSQQEIYEMAKPLREIVRREKRRNQWKKIASVAVCALCLWSVTQYDWSPIILSFYGRYALISLLPYWDWTSYYYQSCLMANPHYEPGHLYEDDCEACESLTELFPRANISHVDMSEDHLKNDVPIVLNNSLANWDIHSGAFSLYNLSKVLTDADPNGDILPCAFASNLRLRGDNYLQVLLTKLQNEKMSDKSWYAHWENCEKSASKAVRRKFAHPDFLPPMVDTTDPNWILISANYEARSYKNVPLIADFMWLSQIHGSNHIRLTPRSPCNNTCLQLSHHLTQGQTVLFTNRMWKMDYLPGGNGVNVAIGGGGSFYDF